MPHYPQRRQRRRSSDDSLTDRKIIRLIWLAKVTPFMDELDGPSVILPVVPRRTRWPIDSDRTKAWIANFILKKTGASIDGRQLGRVLWALKGRAYLGPEMSGDEEIIWSEIVKEPVLQVLVAYLEGQQDNRWEGKTVKLLKALKEEAVGMGIWVESKTWPTLTRLLTAKLNKNRRLLQSLGIHYQQLSRRDASYTSLQWGSRFRAGSVDGDVGEAGDAGDAQTEIVPNPQTTGESGIGDAGDARDDRIADAVVLAGIARYGEELLRTHRASSNEGEARG